MSHGHLSKVERGEHGRPVTPAILAAYEKATGVRLSDSKLIGFGDGSNATVGSVAVGGPVGEPITRMIDAIGRPVVPASIGEGDVVLVEQAVQLATDEDLRAGGGLVGQQARVMLRWAVGLTTTAKTDEINQRLLAAVGALAHRAGTGSKPEL
jgi:hypothetical protein